MRRRAKTDRAKLTKKLDDVVREIVRKRDNMTCQWCGKKVDKSNAHDSHIIPRSRGNALRWDLRNHILLCYHCHINRWHKDPMDAAVWFEQAYPDRWAYLYDNITRIMRFKEADLQALLADLQAKLEEMSK